MLLGRSDYRRRPLAAHSPREIAEGVMAEGVMAAEAVERRREDVAEAIAEGDTEEQVGWVREDLARSVATLAGYHDGTRGLEAARQYLAAVEHETRRGTGSCCSPRARMAREYVDALERAQQQG